MSTNDAKEELVLPIPEALKSFLDLVQIHLEQNNTLSKDIVLAFLEDINVRTEHLDLSKNNVLNVDGPVCYLAFSKSFLYGGFSTDGKSREHEFVRLLLLNINCFYDMKIINNDIVPRLTLATQEQTCWRY